MELQIGVDRLRRPLTVVEPLERRLYRGQMFSASSRRGPSLPASPSRSDRNSKQVGEEGAVAEHLGVKPATPRLRSFPGRKRPIHDAVRTVPSKVSRAIASLTTFRLTPNVSANSRSVGSRSSGLESPSEDFVGNHAASCDGRLGARPSVMIGALWATVRRPRPGVRVAVMTRTLRRRPANAADPDGCRDRSPAPGRDFAILRWRPRRRCGRSA